MKSLICLALLMATQFVFAAENRLVKVRVPPLAQEKEMKIAVTFARDLAKSDCNYKFLSGEIRKEDDRWVVVSDGGYSSTRMGCLNPPKPETIYAHAQTIFLPYNSRSTVQFLVPEGLNIVYRVLKPSGKNGYAKESVIDDKVMHTVLLPQTKMPDGTRVEITIAKFLENSDCNGKYVVGKILDGEDYFEIESTGQYMSTAVACLDRKRNPDWIFGESKLVHYPSSYEIKARSIKGLNIMYRILIPDGDYRKATVK